MTPDQMTELAARLHKQAQIHRHHFKTADQLEWADTIDAAANLIESMAQHEPVATEGVSTVEVPKEEANNYSRILSLLGMEEEGDPVDEIELLLHELYCLRLSRRITATAGKTLTNDQIYALIAEQAHGIRSEK